MALLQIKSDLSMLHSVSSTVLDLGQLITVMIKSREVACRMGILEQRNEYWTLQILEEIIAWCM